jgi:hypothetical protein
VSEGRETIENIVGVTKRGHECGWSDDPTMRTRGCRCMIEIEWIGLADRDAKVRDSFGGYH